MDTTRAKKHASKETVRMVYHASIKSKLQNGIVLWESANKTVVDRLNKLHNKAVRRVIGLLYRTSIKELYHNAVVLLISDLYKYFLGKSAPLHLEKFWSHVSFQANY